MEKKMNNEELQNRREFFKKAAKGALPILAAVALSGVPTIAKSAEKAPMGCEYGCSYSCKGTCSGECLVSCQGCKGTCSATCSGGCRNSCFGTCYSGCARSAYA